MNLSLTPELEKLIKAKVKTGLYNNASEVVREALRFMETNHDLVHHMKLNQLRAELAAGEVEIARGEGIEFENADAIRNYFATIKQ
jgi:antitoxin ParD1/3/4